MVVARGWREGGWESVFNECRVLVGENEEF